MQQVMNRKVPDVTRSQSFYPEIQNIDGTDSVGTELQLQSAQHEGKQRMS
jgi:hypothetical protein